MCWKVTLPNVAELRTGPLRRWRWWGRRTFIHKGVLAETRELASSLSELTWGEATWGPHEQVAVCNQRGEPSPDTSLLAPWNWTSQPPELWNKSLLFKLPRLHYFVTAALSRLRHCVSSILIRVLNASNELLIHEVDWVVTKATRMTRCIFLKYLLYPVMIT